MLGSVACCGMREGISIEVSAADRDGLARIVADRNSPQKHVWRAKIILATAQGCGTAEIMRRAEVSKPCVWRWQERFTREGVAGLVRDKTRKPRAAALATGRGRPGGRADAHRSARRDDPLDRPRDGGGERRIAALGAADLGGARPPATSRPPLQAVHRSSVCGQAARRGGSLSRSAGAQPRCRSTKSPRYRRWTGRSRGCRSRRAGPAP